MTYINKRFIIILQIIILLLLINVCLKASGTDWSITTLDNPAPGYFRFDFSPPSYFFLVDNYGNKQFLDSINPQPSIYNFLLRDGNWISYGITKYYLFNQDRQLIGSIPVPSNYVIDFHAVEILTNGHYLILCDTILDIDLSSIVPNGQKHAKILTNNLVEIDTSGRIYWEWKAYDHLKITDVTPDIDLTQLSIDFTHVNSFAEDKDSNILISFKNLDEITKINKTTGQIMWRMGGSMCKNNQFTFKNDNINGFIGFSHQHSIAILPNGNLLMYDNGGMRNTQFSRAVEYQIDQINKTATKIWDYGNSPPIFQSDQGSVFRLPNGNTLINWGSKQITEVRPDNSKAFELTISAPNLIYKAYKLVTRMNAVSIAISSPGDYNFNDNNFTTGINLSISSLTGSGLTSIEKHNYAPPTGDYLDSDFTFIYPYRWVFSQNGISNISGVIKININSIKKLENPYRVAIYKRDKETVGTFEELNTAYDSTTNELYADFTGSGEFTIGSKVLGVPALFEPNDNEVDVPVNGLLKWYKFQAANNYQIQVSSSRDFNTPFVDQILINQIQFIYQNLDYNTKYYWRVRGINSKDISDWSNIYSFTTTRVTSVEYKNGTNFEPLSFYPNPASDKIQFSDKSYDGKKYSLYDIEGQSFYEGIIENGNIDISSLCTGFYIIKIENQSLKFIKY